MESQTAARKDARTKAGITVLVIFLLMYVPSLLFWIRGENVETGIIKLGVIEDNMNTDGFIIRNEEVLKSTMAGSCILEVEEGDKVPANFRVATVIKASAAGLLEELKKKDNAILQNQIEKSKNQALFSEDLAKLDAEIAQKAADVVTEGKNNNLAAVGNLKEEINRIIARKANIFGSTSVADAYITTLMNDKAKLLTQINQNKVGVVTQSPGIISFSVDGHESQLKPESIAAITPKTLSDIKLKEPTEVSNGVNIQSGAPLLKVIKGIEAYFIIVADAAKASRLPVGSTIDIIRINGIGYSTNGTVYYRSLEEDGRSVVAIRFDKGVSETSGLRKVNIDIVKNSYKGLMVNLSSLRDVDLTKRTATICLEKYDYATFKQVKIIGYNDDFAIIDNPAANDRNGISLYDNYVLQPDNIKEGQMISR